MLEPIFVPSRGRAGKSKTIENLLKEGCNFKVILESEEEAAYAFTYYPDVPRIILPKSNQGIGYVRQFILDHARTQKMKWYWMLDDDISSMCVVENSRCSRRPFKEVLLEAQKQVTARADVAQGALEYQQFAWSQKFPFKFNGYCDVAVMINTELTKNINYRSQMDLKEDRDFTLQILHSGLRTMRTSWCAFAAPKNGSNEGGLKSEYARAGREEEASKRMVKEWPQYRSFNLKPDGRPDVKINWQLFARKPKS